MLKRSWDVQEAEQRNSSDRDQRGCASSGAHVDGERRRERTVAFALAWSLRDRLDTECLDAALNEEDVRRKGDEQAVGPELGERKTARENGDHGQHDDYGENLRDLLQDRSDCQTALMLAARHPTR